MPKKTRTNIKNISASLCFLLVFFLAFSTVFTVLLDKEQSWYKHRNYMNLQKNTVDILYVGNSHFNAAINAAQIDELVGGTFGFNYGVSGMRMDFAYYRLEEALLSQKPSLVVLDTFCLVPLNEEKDTENIISWSLDGIPLSPAKIAAVKDLVPKQHHLAYFVPFIKYHARWEHLKAEDFVGAFNTELYSYFGRQPETTDAAMEKEDEHFAQDLSLVKGEIAVEERHMEYLQKFVALAQQNGAKVLLFATPYRQQFGQNSAQGVQVHNYLQNRLVNGTDVQILDANQHYAQMSFAYEDMRDDGHVNFAGSKKTSLLLAGFIRDNYSF